MSSLASEKRTSILESAEREENSQIQSSLPFYFDHVFGSAIGFSQTQVPTTLSPTPSPTSSQQVLESQGFGAEAPEKLQDNHDQAVGKKTNPKSSTPSPLASGLQDSIALFSSPDSSEGVTFLLPRKPNSKCKENDDDIPPRAVNKRKRKRLSKDGSSFAEEYLCPPSCTALSDCVAGNKTVDLLAAVVQGLRALEPPNKGHYGSNI